MLIVVLMKTLSWSRDQQRSDAILTAVSIRLKNQRKKQTLQSYIQKFSCINEDIFSLHPVGGLIVEYVVRNFYS